MDSGPVAVESSVEVFECEDDVRSGWYLHRFGDGKHMVIILKTDTLLGNNICNSKVVSPQHVALRWTKNGSWILEDLKSKHGTYVNDSLVPGDGVLLKEWDVICLGRKRPRNEDEFGFILKFREESEPTNSDNESADSVCSRTIKDSSSEQSEKRNKGESSDSSGADTMSQNGNKIDTTEKGKISSHSSESSPSSKGNSPSCDSELTLKIPSNLTTQKLKLPEVQEEMLPSSEKVGKWLFRDEQATVSSVSESKEKFPSEKESAEDVSDVQVDISSDSSCYIVGFSNAIPQQNHKKKKYHKENHRTKHKQSKNSNHKSSSLQTSRMNKEILKTDKKTEKWHLRKRKRKTKSSGGEFKRKCLPKRASAAQVSYIQNNSSSDDSLSESSNDSPF